MSLLRIDEAETSINLPKYTERSFVFRNNYFVVTNGEFFNYYPIKAEESGDHPIIRMSRLPPVVLEGYALVNKKVYLVTLQDLQRKIIRKSREIERETQNDTDSTNLQSLSTILDDDGNAVVRRIDESGTLDASEVEIAEAANAAWEDQIGALYGDPFEEEDDWEVQDDS